MRTEERKERNRRGSERRSWWKSTAGSAPHGRASEKQNNRAGENKDIGAGCKTLLALQ